MAVIPYSAKASPRFAGGKESPRIAGDVGQCHISDARIEHLHKRRERNRNRDDPGIAFGLPDILFGSPGCGRAHRTLTSGSTDRPGLSSPSALKSCPATWSKSIRTGTRWTTFT